MIRKHSACFETKQIHLADMNVLLSFAVLSIKMTRFADFIDGVPSTISNPSALVSSAIGEFAIVCARSVLKCTHLFYNIMQPRKSFLSFYGELRLFTKMRLTYQNESSKYAMDHSHHEYRHEIWLYYVNEQPDI